MSVWKSNEKLLIFASLISPFKSFCLRSNIKHSTQCFITRWNTSKFVKNIPLLVVFATLFSVFHLVIKYCVSCLIYYIKWFSVCGSILVVTSCKCLFMFCTLCVAHLVTDRSRSFKLVLIWSSLLDLCPYPIPVSCWNRELFFQPVLVVNLTVSWRLKRLLRNLLQSRSERPVKCAAMLSEIHFRSLRTKMLLQSWIDETARQLQV